MRRSGAAGGLLIGMALAGAVLLPSSTTLALLGDRATVDAVAGAASLVLAARPAAVDGAEPPDLTLSPGGSGDVRVGTSGDLPWALQVHVVDDQGRPDCDVAARLAVGTGLGGAVPGPSGDCSRVLTRTGTGTAAGTITVQLTEEPPDGPWTGSLRVSLQQQPGGFDDQVDVPLRLLDEAAAPAQSVPADLPVDGDEPAEPPATGRSGAVDPSPGSPPRNGSAAPGSAPADVSAPAPSGTAAPTTSSSQTTAPTAAADEPPAPEPADAGPSDGSGGEDGGSADPVGSDGAPADGAPASAG